MDVVTSPSATCMIKPLIKELPVPSVDTLVRWHNSSSPPWTIITACHNDDVIYIYTDGSKTATGVGASAYVTSHLEEMFLSWTLPAHTSVLQAELLAIYLSLKQIKESNTNVHGITIFSDSKAAIEQILGPKIKICSLARQTRALLSSIGLIVNIEWVRSHSVNGNIIADRLAKEAAIRESVTELSELPLCPYEAKKLINELINIRWETEWTRASVGAIKRQFFPSPQSANILNNSYIPHETTQILSGHSVLNYHLAKTNLIPSSACQCGFPIEDINLLQNPSKWRT